MIWREPTNHVTGCYFCAIDFTGINRKNRSSLTYPDLDAARRPVAHCEEIPIPVFKEFPETSNDASSSFSGYNYDKETPLNDRAPQPLSQNELNDLVHDINLLKWSAELLASRLPDQNLLEDSVRISFYRNRHQEFLPFFSEENDLVYCIDIIQLLHNLGVSQYEAKDWRLFIDSSKRSLECVLLHNGNQFSPVPHAHSTALKEKYEAVKNVLEKISYNEHQWLICVDLKMLNFLLGQQSRFTKYPCFLFVWDSRDTAQHYERKTGL